MSNAKVTSKGQITVPKEIREYLDLNSGDRIEFIVNSEGEVIIRPCTYKVSDLKGLLKAKVKKKVTTEDMEKAIRNRRSK